MRNLYQCRWVLGRNGFATKVPQQQVGIIYTPNRQKGGIVAA